MYLSEDDRKVILGLVRRAVEEAVCRDRLLGEVPPTELFSRRSGVFVTLQRKQRLRGCIGVTEPRESLGEALVRCAAGAAREDPRFDRVLPEEMNDLEIEVSLLSALVLLRPEEIEIGTHGLLVEQGARRGLLLPQVAVEHHLDRERFLEETCCKAGLPSTAWQEPGTRIYGFTCEILRENE